MFLDSKGISVLNVSNNEGFKQRYDLVNICKNGGVINKPVLSLFVSGTSHE